MNPEKDDSDLESLLNPKGKIGRLRRRLMAFLLDIEDAAEILKAVDKENAEYLEEVIGKITLMIHDFAAVQVIADRKIADFSPEERLFFFNVLPEIFEIFGWQNKINGNGKIEM